MIQLLLACVILVLGKVFPMSSSLQANSWIKIQDNGCPKPVSRNFGESLPKKCPDCPSSELSEKMIKKEVEKLARRNLRKCKKLAKITLKAAKVAQTIQMVLNPSADPDAAPVQRIAEEQYRKLNHFVNRVPPALEDWKLSVEDVLLAD